MASFLRLFLTLSLASRQFAGQQFAGQQLSGPRFDGRQLSGQAPTGSGRRAARPTAAVRALRGLTAGLSSMASLVTGAECAACGQPEVLLCPPCRSELHRRAAAPVPVGHRAPALADRPDRIVLAADDYGGVLAQVILSQKRLGHRVLSRELGALLHRVIWAFPSVAAEAVPREAPTDARPDAPSAAGPGPAGQDGPDGPDGPDGHRIRWLIPVPGSGASYRKRGFDPLALVVRCAAAAGLPPDCALMPALAVRGLPERLAGALRHAVRPSGEGGTATGPRGVVRLLGNAVPRSGSGQKGLGAAARRRRLAGSMRLAIAFRLRHGTGALRGADCILVDDVLTTGATLAEAARVLEDAGARVLGAVVLAAARPPADRGGSQEEISEQGMNYRALSTNVSTGYQAKKVPVDSGSERGSTVKQTGPGTSRRRATETLWRTPWSS